MIKSVVVDASVWVSRFMPQETYHAISSRWMTHFSLSGGLFVVPAFLLVEVAAAISRNSGQARLAKRAVEDLKTSEAIQLIALDSIVVQSAIDVAADLQLRAGAATYVAVAHQLHIPLITWDKEQLARATSLVRAYSPDTYPLF
jgi:predicted nucleic acid-binding protein